MELIILDHNSKSQIDRNGVKVLLNEKEADTLLLVNYSSVLHRTNPSFSLN